MTNSTVDAWSRGKVAFVTGATAGIGAAFTRRFLDGGGRVIATGRRRERLNQLASNYSEDRLLTLQLDIQNAASVANALVELPPDFAAIDVLFNNAGLALGLEPSQAVDIDDWEIMVNTNILGLIRLTRLILPAMVIRNSGAILNMGSVAGTYPYPGGNVYGATKAFVRQFSLNLRADLLGTNIRVTSIEPGMCATEFSSVRYKGDKVRADDVYDGITPLSAGDIADLACTLLRLPEHINVNTIELMPVRQAFGAFAVHRG